DDRNPSGGMPMATKFDAIVIGTGQAGPSLAVRLADARMKVAIIERKRFGGTCVNNGCIPTKTLVASARTAHVVRRADDYGVTIPGSIAVDMKKVKMRKDAVVRQSTVGLEFAQMYRRFGSEVTVVERGPRLIHREDEDISENIKTILEGEGIKIRLGADCIALEKRDDKVAVQVDCSSGDKIVMGSHVL